MKTIPSLNSLKNLAFRSGFRYFRMSMLQPPYWVTANGKVERIFAGEDLGSATCYREIVVDDCYDIFNYAKDLNPSVIVDIGANVGIFSKLCSLLFPSASIYAYEPNPIPLNWLRKNAEFTRINVFPCAIDQEAGTVMLDNQDDSTVGRICESGNLPVTCMSVSSVAEGRPIDLLKMDCEGSEWSILQNTELLRRTQNFCMEYHLFEQQTIQDLKHLIKQAGHRVVRIRPQTDSNSTVGFLWSVLASN